MPSARDIWILAEQSGGELEDITLELVSGARQLADEFEEEVHALVIGGSDEGLAETLAGYGTDKVYFLDSPLLSGYSAETAAFYIDTLSKLSEAQKPRKILCADNTSSMDLACRLAARLKTGVVTGCVGLSLGEEGQILQSKLTHGGKISSTLFCPDVTPEVATIKPGIVEKKMLSGGRKAEIVLVKPELEHAESGVKTLGFVKADPDSIGLDEVDIIVAGGRGMDNVQNFVLLENLAKHLGGVVAGSLGAVDNGWLPRQKLVGQTGMSVAPKLYIACGISGSIYHVLGMKDSKVIVAINKDRHAPIFKHADFGIVGDVMEVIPSMIGQLQELAQSLVSDNGVSDD
jgi:electron transfer flavoprotein alpha subunit